MTQEPTIPTPPLTASEALYAFAAWLTTRDEPVVASAKHDAAPWAEMVRAFCEAHGFEPPREKWTELIVHTCALL